MSMRGHVDTKNATHVTGSLPGNAELSECIATILQPTSNSLAYAVFSIFGVVSCPGDRVNDRRALFGMRNKDIFQVFDSLRIGLDHSQSLEGSCAHTSSGCSPCKSTYISSSALLLPSV